MRNIELLIELLILELGYKKNELEVVKYLGVYFITLPTYHIPTKHFIILNTILPKRASIGIYKNIFSGLSIRTEIKVE